MFYILVNYKRIMYEFPNSTIERILHTTVVVYLFIFCLICIYFAFSKVKINEVFFTMLTFIWIVGGILVKLSPYLPLFFDAIF